MPSAFESIFATSSQGLYDTFGLTAVYKGPDGASVTTGADGNPLQIRVHRNEPHQTDTHVRSDEEIQSGEVIVRQADIAKPLKGGRFTVEGNEVWTIELTPMAKNGQHYCTCSRSGVERQMPRRASS